MSIVIPTYNCGKYIADAIESVLSQTYGKLEIIVVDDGSTDGTEAALAPYWGRITYVHQRNQGVVAARNVGIQQSRGDLIAFLDADDVWYREKLALQVDALQRYPGSALSFTDCCYFDEVGTIYTSFFGPIVRTWVDKHTNQGSCLAHGWIFGEMLRSNCMHTSSVVVKRDVLEKVGSFDEAFKICQDYDLWLRISKKYPVLCLNSVLCGYRRRPEGLSGSEEMREIRWNQEWIEVLEKHLRRAMIPDELRGLARTVVSQRYWWLGWRHFSHNQFGRARSLFMQGIRYRPLYGYHWVYWGASLLPMPIIEGLRRMKRALA